MRDEPALKQEGTDGGHDSAPRNCRCGSRDKRNALTGYPINRAHPRKPPMGGSLVLLLEMLMRTLKQFLESRYPSGCYALTRAEAILLGINYPLRTGWIRAHGDTVLTEVVIDRLDQLRSVGRKKARKLARSMRDGKQREAQRELNLPAYQKTFEASKGFLQTYEWRKVRMQALKLYGAKCVACGATTKDGVRLHVDHIKPRALYPHLALTLENLQVLCEECNHGKGNWDITDWRQDADVSGSLGDLSASDRKERRGEGVE